MTANPDEVSVFSRESGGVRDGGLMEDARRPASIPQLPAPEASATSAGGAQWVYGLKASAWGSFQDWISYTHAPSSGCVSKAS